MSLKQAEEEISSGLLNLVTWGRYLIANPDFVTKLKTGEKLEEYNIKMLNQLV